MVGPLEPWKCGSVEVWMWGARGGLPRGHHRATTTTGLRYGHFACDSGANSGISRCVRDFGAQGPPFPSKECPPVAAWALNPSNSRARDRQLPWKL